MIVVSNTSPLISLAHIGLFNLLASLYSALLVPQAVWDEIVVSGANLPGAQELRGASWVTMVAVQNQPLVQALRQELDAGEAEAIALTLEANADLLIMDERLGRETARHLGLRYTGTIGVLVDAKSSGLIELIRPHLDALRQQAGFWIHDNLYQRVLIDAGETA